jgi:hypothetical protein
MAMKFSGKDVFKNFRYNDYAFQFYSMRSMVTGLGIESIIVENEVMFIFFKPAEDSIKKGYVLTLTLLLDSGAPVTFETLPGYTVKFTYTRNGEKYYLYVVGSEDNKMNYTFAPECD